MADLSRVAEMTARWLDSQGRPRETAACSAARIAEEIRSSAYGSTVQQLVGSFLEVQKARMALQLALFAAAVTLTATAFQFTNAVLFLVAAAVVPLAWLSDYITKRNALCPLLYRLARLEIDHGAAEPLALLFVAYDRRGLARFRSLLERGSDRDSRILFRRQFLRRDFPFRIVFFGGIFSSELVLAWVFRHWLPALSIAVLEHPVVDLIG